MTMVGICSVCGRPAGSTCPLCGRLVCRACSDPGTGVCTGCRAKQNRVSRLT